MNADDLWGALFGDEAQPRGTWVEHRLSSNAAHVRTVKHRDGRVTVDVEPDRTIRESEALRRAVVPRGHG